MTSKAKTPVPRLCTRRHAGGHYEEFMTAGQSFYDSASDTRMSNMQAERKRYYNALRCPCLMNCTFDAISDSSWQSYGELYV